MEWIVETERLGLRKLRQSDRPALCRILQDADVMYAYAHAFSDAEVDAWLARQIGRYAAYGNFGLWAVILKTSGQMIGQCGLTMQDAGGREVLEVGYLFEKAFWHRGYAAEAARACRDYAFQMLGAGAVYSIIRENNGPSLAVARKNGMEPKGNVVKFYYGMTMPHVVYSIEKNAWKRQKEKEDGYDGHGAV